MELNPQIFNSANRSISTTRFKKPGQLISGSSNNRFSTTLTNPAINIEFNGLAALTSNLEVDTSFNDNVTPGVVLTAINYPGTDQIIIGGDFTSVGGVQRNRIAIVLSNGAVGTFNPSCNAAINEIAPTSNNDKVLIAGAFTSIAGSTRTGLVRLNLTSQTVEGTFAGQTNNTVNAVRELSDQKIAVGGIFSQIAGVSRNRFAILNPDGSSTSANIAPNDAVEVIFQHSSGSIIVGGRFTQINDVARNLFYNKQGLFSVNAELLQVDDLFNSQSEFFYVFIPEIGPPPGFTFDSSAITGSVFAINEDLTSNMILVGGNFSITRTTTSGGAQIIEEEEIGGITVGTASTSGGTTAIITRTNMARVDLLGQLDSTFDAQVNGTVESITIANDGDYIISGTFTQVNGVTRRGLAKLKKENGALDASFNPVTSTPVRSVTKLDDGRIILGGNFSKGVLADTSASIEINSSYPNSIGWTKPSAALRPSSTNFNGLNLSNQTPGTYYVGQGLVSIGASASIPVGSVYTFRANRTSSQLPYFIVASGVTLYTCLGSRIGNTTNVNYQFMLRTSDSTAHLVKISASEWILFGDIII